MTLEPLELLYERPDLPQLELPAELRRLYGGGFGFDEPCVYANFVQTIDGVVAIPDVEGSNALVADGSAADRFVMGLLRAAADTVLVGSGTLRASPLGGWRPDGVFPDAAAGFAELRRSCGRSERPTVAIVTSSASLDPSYRILEEGAVVLTVERSASPLRVSLPAASEVVAAGNGERVDLGAALAALRDRGHMLVLSEAGPTVFGSLVAAGLVDELFLTASTVLAGRTDGRHRAALVEGVELLPDVQRRGRLLSVRRQSSHLLLRYSLRA